jgi:two-component system, sporulation sensor kinase B
MRNLFKNVSLNSQVMVLTLCVTFFVVLSTGGVSLFLQMKEMKEQLTHQVAGLASLWSSTINSEDVDKVIRSKDVTDPLYVNLHDHLSLINEKNAEFLHGFIIMPKLYDGEVHTIVPSKSGEVLGVQAFSPYHHAPDKFKEALLNAVYTNEVAYSSIYDDFGKTWISAFSPIRDSNGNIISLLVVSAEASIIASFHTEIIYSLCIVFLVITLFVYFVFKRGINRVLEPVNEIIKGINEVSNGNFQVKVPIMDQSDFGQLTARFNYMTEQLSLLFDRLTVTSNHLGKNGQALRQSSKFEDAIGEMENIIQKTKILKELQRAEKMNAIGQLAASVAHEIRNPMTVVKGFLQIFKAKKELSAEEQMFVKLMIDEMDRAETIINDYLSLAKPDMENTERVDAAELANKAMDLMNSYAMMSKNIELKTIIEEQLFVNGNRSELKQVLINILKNGIEAMKDGGSLILKVYKVDQYGVFEIQDNGIGMTKDELERLGTAFYSLKEKGTGMGLMVCYQIIERMKGKIEVVSEKGKGTTFSILVPLDKEDK